MLTRATWLARVVATVVVGVLIFGSAATTRHNLALEIVAYAISVLATGYSYVATLRPRLSLPVGFGLGAMAAAAGVTTEAPHGTAFIAFVVIAVLVASTDAEPIVGWAITGIGALAIEIGAIIWGAHTASILGFPLLLLTVFIAGRNRRASILQARQSELMLEQVEQLRVAERDVAVLDERNRIAREIHDVLAHSLGALGIQIQSVRAVLSDQSDIPRALTLLEQAQRMTTDGLVDTRRAVQALRGDSTRLDRQIEELVETHRSRYNANVDFAIDGEPVLLAPEATVALVRTTQEALVNTAKHATHQPVDVRLSYAFDEVRLLVTNPLSDVRQTDGASFTSVDGGYGLTGMRERLVLINGTLMTGADDRHWTVDARVPR